jgi:hypothetical protein
VHLQITSNFTASAAFLTKQRKRCAFEANSRALAAARRFIIANSPGIHSHRSIVFGGPADAHPVETRETDTWDLAFVSGYGRGEELARGFKARRTKNARHT